METGRRFRLRPADGAPGASSGTTVDVLRAVWSKVGLDRAMELLEGSRRYVDRSAQTDDLDALVAMGALHPDPAGFEDDSAGSGAARPVDG